MLREINIWIEYLELPKQVNDQYFGIWYYMKDQVSVILVDSLKIV